MRRCFLALGTFLVRISTGGLLVLPHTVVSFVLVSPTRQMVSTTDVVLFYKASSSLSSFQNPKQAEKATEINSEPDDDIPDPSSIDQHHLHWLRQATNHFVNDTSISLASKGHWHQVVSLMRAWRDLTPRLSSPYEGPLEMEALLKRLVDEQRPDVIVLDISIYNLLLQAWCQAEHPARAREWLVTLQEQHEQQSQSTLLQPNYESFDCVWHAVCRHEPYRYVRRLQLWRNYLAQHGKNTQARLTVKQGRSWLGALQEQDWGAEAERFWKHWESSLANLNENELAVERDCKRWKPNTACFNLVLGAYRKEPKEAQRVLETMMAQYAEQSTRTENGQKKLVVRPNQKSYQLVISAWATTASTNRRAIEHIQTLLQSMQHNSIRPSPRSLQAAMNAWVQSRKPESVEQTAQLLEQFPVNQRSIAAYNSHLHALSLLAPKDSGYAQRAYDILQTLRDDETAALQPNTFTYNIVMEAQCRVGNSQRAATVLSQLVHSTDDSAQPNTFSFNQVLAVLAKTSPHTAERLFEYMEQAYKSGLHPQARPDACTLSSVIVAFSKQGNKDAATKATQIVDQWETAAAADDQHQHPRPNLICYNALIDCWAKSKAGTFAARQAEAVFEKMQRAGIEPNLLTYNTILNAWARSNTRCCARKAEFYLQQMWDLYHAGDTKVQPNDFSYNTVINAISKSKDERKAQKALQTLRRMDKLYQAGHTKAKPNEVTYTAVLNSCAFPPAVLDARARRRALDVAIFTLHELQGSRYGRPNQISYGTFIKACDELLRNDDEFLRKVLRQAFEQCCRDGQVGDMVLTHLRRAAPKDLYEELLADAGVHNAVATVHDLPPAWRKNLDNNPRRRSKQYRKKPPKRRNLRP